MLYTLFHNVWYTKEQQMGAIASCFNLLIFISLELKNNILNNLTPFFY